MLVALDGREREIPRLRFGLDWGQPRALDRAGEVFDLTRERTRQSEIRAMSKLRHPSVDAGAPAATSRAMPWVVRSEIAA